MPRLKINFKKGDRVKINEGTFENFEGEVEAIDEANGRVTVMLSIFGVRRRWTSSIGRSRRRDPSA